MSVQSIKLLPALLIGSSLFLLCALTAFAHPGHATSADGMAQGLIHPFFGWDHLLAMVSIGLVCAQIGGRAMWAIPLVFLGSLFLGSLVGGELAGTVTGAISLSEHTIATSIVVLGSAVAWNRRWPLAPSLILVAVFGFVHGQAHAAEFPTAMLPTAINPAPYVTGFAITTAVLHLAGIAAGKWALNSVRGTAGLRISGGAIAAAGAYLALFAS
jgi:urease accessory protein